ncbi:MAG: hypothetical protein VB021_05500 [Oscillospiraceae bacterium]|nr:hypothetical protein [Oscillospiraceae bacterium]
MKLLTENQNAPIQSEVLARIALIRPILSSLLTGIKADVMAEFGGVENIKLKMLSRAYRPGAGDIGFCFEWAIHDAVRRNDSIVLERLSDAAKRCKLQGNDYKSILFGLEKNGKVQVIDTASHILTSESRLLTGAQAQPPKLKNYLNMLSAAFNRPETRNALPYSISGLWKADLFFGAKDSDRWLGTTLKINPTQLEGARGLRIGIVPASQGKSDKVYVDDRKNLVVCPIPYDGSFMELFYTSWGIVQQFIAADAQLPKEVSLPMPVDRQAVKELVTRRDFPAVDVIEALEPLSQADLTVSTEKEISADVIIDGDHIFNNAIIAPVATLTQTN